MTTQINSNNIQSSTLATLGGPKVTNLQVTNSGYTPTGATTVSTSGGYILITGSGFNSGVQVTIGNTAATSVGYVSSTSVQAQVPAKTAGTYIVYVSNTNGSFAIRAPGLTYA